MPVEWVEPEWVYENLHHDGVRIIDAQPKVHDYFKKHLPGAVYLNEEVLRSTYLGMPCIYNESHFISRILERCGIDNDTSAIVYSGPGALFRNGDYVAQYMVAYSLQRMGLEKIYILDGGLEEWTSLSLPTTKKFPSVSKTHFSPHLARDIFVDYEEFLKIQTNESSAMILDARSPLMYEGQGPWIKPGHILGSINMPWRMLVEESNPAKLLDISRIGEILSKKGIDGTRRIISTCGTGREATALYLILRWIMKYSNVQIFEGSFTMWTAYEKNPTIVGRMPNYTKE